MKEIKLLFKGSGGEFQYHRLNKEDALYLKEEHDKDREGFAGLLQGGDSFEEEIWAGSFGPSISDIEIKNEETSETFDLTFTEQERVFFADGEDNIKSDCIDYFYITEGKVYGAITIELEEEEFSPDSLAVKYMEYALDGYPEKFGTIITEITYDGELCNIETTDNGQETYKCLLGYEMEDGDLLDYLVVYDTNNKTECDWSLLEKIFLTKT